MRILFVVACIGCASHRSNGTDAATSNMPDGDPHGGAFRDSAASDAAHVDPCATSPWHEEMVDSWSGDQTLSMLYTPIIVDGDAIELAYAMDDSSGLPSRVARRANGGWTIQQVSTRALSNVVRAVSVQGVDYSCWSEGTAVTSAMSNFGCTRHAPNAAPTTELVLPNSYVHGVSLAIDPDDRVHLTYANANENEYYAIRDTDGTWHTETLGGHNYANPLAVDHAGCVHVARVDHIVAAGQDAVEHGVRCGDGPIAWDIAEQFLGDPWLDVRSLAIDAQDRVHIIYNDANNTALRHAVKTGTSWSVETIAEAAPVAFLTWGISADPSGGVYITYMTKSGEFSGTAAILHLAADGSRDVYSFGAWTYTGSVVSAVDAGGRVHVALDGDDKSLKYATSCPATSVTM